MKIYDEFDDDTAEGKLPLSFADYQTWVNSMAFYPVLGHPVVYPTLGMNGEAAEALEKALTILVSVSESVVAIGRVSETIKKTVRDKKGFIDQEKRDKLALELGDALWYISQTSREIGLDLEIVARMNIRKLNDRKARGTRQGEGDNR